MGISQLNELQIGTAVTLKVVVGEIVEKPAKNNSTFLNIGLGDSTGRIEGKMFSANRSNFLANTGDLVRVTGKTNLYNGAFQLIIDSHQKVADASQLNHADYIPSYPSFYVENAKRGLIELSDSLEDERYRKLVKYVMGIEGDKSSLEDFMLSVGSVNFHHNKAGGLAIHTYGVARIADRVCKLYGLTGTKRAQLVFLAIVHDVQKRYEYETFPVTRRTELVLSHVTRGASFVEAINMYYGDLLPPDELVLCQKALYLHHGEWSNYKVNELIREEYPIEAKLLHSFDQIEASMCDLYEGNEEGYLKALFSS